MIKTIREQNENVKPNTTMIEELRKKLPQYFVQNDENITNDTVGAGVSHTPLQFDLDRFIADLRANNVQEAHTGYHLSFVGEDYARLQTGLASETLIKPEGELQMINGQFLMINDSRHCEARSNPDDEIIHSISDDENMDCFATTRNDEGNNTNHSSLNTNRSQNIFITGDNLEALRHLQNAYTGKVKMIYIDPPYNTGKEFTYSDKFEFTDEELASKLGYSPEDVARLRSIQGKSSHSAWLTFMYPRLKLAQKLLTDDGVIFVSIDDNEQANLKLLMDNVFGEGNFVSNFIWQKNFAPKNDNKYISISTDYIYCYGKSIGNFNRNLLPRTKQQNETYSNPDNDIRGSWTSGSMLATTFSNTGVFEIIAPNGKKHLPPIGRCWRYSKESLKNLINDNRVWFGSDGNNVPRVKRFLSEMPDGVVPQNLLLYKDVGSNQEGNNDLKKLFEAQLFDFPKGVKLIKHLLLIATHKDSIILDFFAGSSTTAEAVMRFNAEDGGNRKFIMVQLDEPTAKDSAASKAGYNTIDEISRDRIRRAAAVIAKTKSEAIQNKQPLDRFVPRDDEEKGGQTSPLRSSLDLGFRHYRLINASDKTLDKIMEFDPAAPRLIADDMVAELGGEQTILTTWLIDDGYDFSVTPKAIDIKGYTAHYVDNSVLYLIAKDWGAKQTKTLLNMAGTSKLNLNTIIVFGYSFTFESLRELELNVKTTLQKQITIEKRY